MRISRDDGTCRVKHVFFWQFLWVRRGLIELGLHMHQHIFHVWLQPMLVPTN